MARTFQLSIVAPDKSVLDEPVESVTAPGSEGYFGVLPGHVPFISALRPGIVEYLTKDGRHHVAVSGGFAEVTPEKVTVLADAAERATEIDIARAEAALENARRALRGEDSAQTSEEALNALDRAVNRLRAANLARK
jgi:F-type H+-transporting ATPase subunit epsilon